MDQQITQLTDALTGIGALAAVLAPVAIFVSSAIAYIR